MSSETQQQQPEPPEEQLCTSCATPNSPVAHFCAKCGAPLSSFAMIAPFERLFAEGFIYRTAAEHPRSLITVSGIWLIFGILAAAGLMIAMLAIATNIVIDSIVGIIVGAAIIVVSLLIVFKSTRNYLARKQIGNE